MRNNAQTCICYYARMNISIDERKQQLVKKYVSDGKMKKLASFFDVLSDGTRLKILSALAITPMCVSDLSAVLEINQTTVSHQLARMRLAAMVDFRREGKACIYYVCDKGINNVLLQAVECS